MSLFWSYLALGTGVCAAALLAGIVKTLLNWPRHGRPNFEKDHGF